MEKYITEAQLRQRASQFIKKYKSSKKNINRLKDLNFERSLPIINILREVDEVDCQPGCSYCCNLRVSVFDFELIAIYKHAISFFSEEVLSQTKQRIDQQYDVIKDMTVDEHHTTNVTCPMLVDKKCSIYKVRPLACASYHSLSVSACKHSDENPHITGTDSGGIPLIQEIKNEQDIQNAIAGRVMMEEGREPVMIELISGLKDMFDHPGNIPMWQMNQETFIHSSKQSML